MKYKPMDRNTDLRSTTQRFKKLKHQMRVDGRQHRKLYDTLRIREAM